MGYSIIAVKNTHLELLEMNVLRMAAKKDNYERLKLIHQKISTLIKEYRPHCFAIEAPFFGKNVQSMLKLGRAQGVAIAAAMEAKLEVFEYAPKKVKQSITGNGNADKDQVWKMLQQLLSLKPTVLKYYDASDALAVAVCHHFQEKPSALKTGKKLKGWEEFIAKNPGKVRNLKI